MRGLTVGGVSEWCMLELDIWAPFPFNAVQLQLRKYREFWAQKTLTLARNGCRGSLLM